MYESIKISPKLDQTIQTSFAQSKKRTIRFYKPVLSFATTFCVMFVVLLNVNRAFAEAAAEIPIVGKIAQVFTLREYKEEQEDELISVKMPAISNTGNSELEKRVNEQILKKVNVLLAESKQVAKEFKEGMEEARNEIGTSWYEPIEITIDYEVKKCDDKYLSFVISKSESFFRFYEERYYYNIDLETGEDITLQDIFKEDYPEALNAEIIRQMKMREQENENVIFFDVEDEEMLEHGFSFTGISQDQGFYLAENGNVVICFPKYSIAPGYMGIVEFEIERK